MSVHSYVRPKRHYRKFSKWHFCKSTRRSVCLFKNKLTRFHHKRLWRRLNVRFPLLYILRRKKKNHLYAPTLPRAIGVAVHLHRLLFSFQHQLEKNLHQTSFSEWSVNLIFVYEEPQLPDAFHLSLSTFRKNLLNNKQAPLLYSCPIAIVHCPPSRYGPLPFRNSRRPFARLAVDIEAPELVISARFAKAGISHRQFFNQPIFHIYENIKWSVRRTTPLPVFRLIQCSLSWFPRTREWWFRPTLLLRLATEP